MVENGQFKKARKLQRIYDETTITKPELKNVDPELDSRFVKIKLNEDGFFDGWISFSCLGTIPNQDKNLEGTKILLDIPFKKHKHFNKMLSKGQIKSGVRLGSNSITMMFDLPDVEKKKDGKTLGIDIGQNTTLSCSNGQMIGIDSHGHDFKTICNKLSRCKKGSLGFKRAEAHRDNYLNWSIKQLNLDGVNVVNRENIKYLRRGRTSSRSLSHWTYGEFFGKLDQKLNDAGVQVVKLNPTYTSQRCSSCGWVQKGNRKKKKFVCSHCGFACDSDQNASRNIALELQPLPAGAWRKKLNLKGFFWLQVEHEPIVRVTQKTN